MPVPWSIWVIGYVGATKFFDEFGIGLGFRSWKFIGFQKDVTRNFQGFIFKFHVKFRGVINSDFYSETMG